MSILRECGGFISGSSDNLGNHTASQNLEMSNFSITNASGITSFSSTTRVVNFNPTTSGTWNVSVGSGRLNFKEETTSTLGLSLHKSGQVQITQPLTNLNAAQVLVFDSGTSQMYIRPLSGISGASDNLGNHKATQHLNMAGFSVTGVNSFIGTSNIVDNTTYKDNLGSFEWFVDVDGSDSLTFTNFNTTEIPLTLNPNGSIKIATPSVNADNGIYLLLHNQSDGLIYRRTISSISGADNLGNHKATQNLNMSGWGISNVGGITFNNVPSGVYFSHQLSDYGLGLFDNLTDSLVARFTSYSHPSGATLWIGDSTFPTIRRPPVSNNAGYVLVWNSGGMGHGMVGLRDINDVLGGGPSVGSGCAIAFSYADVPQSGTPTEPLEPGVSDIQVEVKDDVINFWANISGSWVLDKVFSGGEGTYFIGETDNGNSGSSKTIDFTSKANHKLTLTANCTLTFTDPASARSTVIRFVQDGVGGRTVTLPTGVLGNMSLLSGINQQTVVNFYFDGTNYHV